MNYNYISLVPSSGTVNILLVLAQEGKPPEFEYPEGQYPEQVDWLGQKAQIDAAKKGKVNQVVIVSSMGGSDENNRLNALGNGKILIYKRMAEKYLISQDDFASYFILHPGGLIDEKVPPTSPFSLYISVQNICGVASDTFCLKS